MFIYKIYKINLHLLYSLSENSKLIYLSRESETRYIFLTMINIYNLMSNLVNNVFNKETV